MVSTAQTNQGKERQQFVPQPKQWAFISCPIPDALFGGSRGGGKTAGLLLDFAAHAARYPNSARGLIARRSYPELEEVIDQSHQIFPYVGSGGLYNVQQKTWRWAEGAILRLRHFIDEKTVREQQGFSNSYVGIDEITNMPSLKAIDMLRATLRSAHGTPVYFRCTGNPGGVLHTAIKERYVDPAPPMTPFTATEKVGNRTVQIERIYLPSTLDDNLILQQNDPEYESRLVLSAAGNENLLQAWRYGLWSIADNAMFAGVWSEKHHIIEPFGHIPKTWRVDRSFDWGSSKPFAALWWAESDGTTAPNGRNYPPGTLFLIGELYGWNGKANEGLRLANTTMGQRIKEREEGLKALYRIAGVRAGPADNQIFDVINGTSIADEMGIRWERSNKGAGSRVAGWKKLQGLLHESTQPYMDRPGLFIFSTCRNTIRTLPVLPIDLKNPDDIDTKSEDHIGDAMRYRVLTEKTRAESLPFRF